MRADASGPNTRWAVFGFLVSGVFTPISRMVSDRPSMGPRWCHRPTTRSTMAFAFSGNSAGADEHASNVNDVATTKNVRNMAVGWAEKKRRDESDAFDVRCVR